MALCTFQNHFYRFHIILLQYRRSLYAEYAVCIGHQLPGGAPSQLLTKKKKRDVTRHSRIRTLDGSHLMFVAECK